MSKSMKRKRKRWQRALGAEWTGLCCVCGTPVNDDDGTYIGEGDHIHYDCMDSLPKAKEKGRT